METLAEAKAVLEQYQAERTCQWPVSDNALNAVASNRLQQLARPKSARLHKDDYDPYKVRLRGVIHRLAAICMDCNVYSLSGCLYLYFITIFVV